MNKAVKKWNTAMQKLFRNEMEISMSEAGKYEREMFRNSYPFRAVSRKKVRLNKAF